MEFNVNNYYVGGVMIFLFIFWFDEPRYRLKKIIRFVVYENIVAKLLRNKFLQLVLPGFSGAYFLCLDVWGDKWDFIVNNQSKHELAFSFLIGTSLVVLLARGIADHIDGRGRANHAEFIERFTFLTSKVVKKKLERFKENSLTLSANTNAFKQLTQPKEQINLILMEIIDLLYNSFSIKENEVCITIMHLDPHNNKWYFKYESNRSWQHTRPEVLLNHNSAAKHCLDIGESVFYADKKRASKCSKYHMSERDKRMKTGSVFCYPAFVENKNYEDKYIISIVTYGKIFCDPLDGDQSEAIRIIFSDICRRIDLELTLESIKEWKYGFNSNRTRAE